jgi:hypothetical protein
VFASSRFLWSRIAGGNEDRGQLGNRMAKFNFRKLRRATGKFFWWAVGGSVLIILTYIPIYPGQKNFPDWAGTWQPDMSAEISTASSWLITSAIFVGQFVILYLVFRFERNAKQLTEEAEQLQGATDGPLQQIHKKEMESALGTIQALATQKTDLENRITELTQQQKKAPTARLTVDFIKSIKEGEYRVPVKIVATERFEVLAKILIDAFLTANYEVLLNADNTDHLIRARTPHDITVVRYRRRAENADPEEIARHLLCTAIVSSLEKFIGCTENPFPSTSTINYLQIEVGGAP